MDTRIPLPAALATLVLAPSLAASADPLDCNDMAPVVREMLVDRMQLPEYLALSTAEAAEATFRMNYFHAERREYQRTGCSVMIAFDPIGFAKAERQAAGTNPAQALEKLVRAAAESALARVANFPDGIKVRYRLELIDNGRTWVVVLVDDPVAAHVCALPDRHNYLKDDRPCSSAPGEPLQWRRSGALDPGQLVPGR